MRLMEYFEMLHPTSDFETLHVRLTPSIEMLRLTPNFKTLHGYTILSILLLSYIIVGKGVTVKSYIKMSFFL